MPDLESHWLAERLASLGLCLLGGMVERQKASSSFPCLKGSHREVDGSHQTQAACAAQHWLRHRQRSTSVSG